MTVHRLVLAVTMAALLSGTGRAATTDGAVPRMIGSGQHVASQSTDAHRTAPALVQPETASGVAAPIAGGGRSGALVIHATFDSSITGDPNSAAIQTMINNAVAIYESLFNDAITVNILFRYATTQPNGSALPGGALATSNYVLYSVPWSTYIADLKADATTTNDSTANASLPPSSGLSTNVLPSSAGGRAIGLNTPTAMFANGSVGVGGPYDGIVTLNSSQSFKFTRPAGCRPDAGAHAHRDADPDAHRHAHAHADRDAQRDPHRDRDDSADRDRHPYADADAHPDAVPDADPRVARSFHLLQGGADAALDQVCRHRESPGYLARRSVRRRPSRGEKAELALRPDRRERRRRERTDASRAPEDVPAQDPGTGGPSDQDQGRRPVQPDGPLRQCEETIVPPRAGGEEPHRPDAGSDTGDVRDRSLRVLHGQGHARHD